MSINKDSQKAPNLRFKGFTDDWEQRKLGEIADVKDSARISNELWVENGIPYLRSSDLVNGELNGELFISNDTYEKYASKTGAPQKDDVLFTSGGKVGIVYHKMDDSPVYVQGGAVLYVKTSTSVLLEGSFLSVYFSSPKMQLYLDIASSGGTIKHFTLKPANSSPIVFPSISEQSKIGQFFKTLDDTITLHQRKLDQLNQLKEALLKQMFPGKGETVPKLRFAGFEGDWEERKLGELSNIVGGGTPSTSNPEYWDGDIDWYAPAEIGEQSYVSKSKKTITELGLKKSSARILPVGTVLFTSRAGIGNTAILAKDATTNQGFQSIVPDKNKLDSYFIFSRTNELKRYGEVTGAGSTFVEVSGKQMSKMPIKVPVLSEQQRIGTFFKSLDDTITLQQRKLDQLKNTKQVLLQNMFI